MITLLFYIFVLQTSVQALIVWDVWRAVESFGQVDHWKLFYALQFAGPLLAYTSDNDVYV